MIDRVVDRGVLWLLVVTVVSGSARYMGAFWGVGGDVGVVKAGAEGVNGDSWGGGGRERGGGVTG